MEGLGCGDGGFRMAQQLDTNASANQRVFSENLVPWAFANLAQAEANLFAGEGTKSFRAVCTTEPGACLAGRAP